MNSSSKKTANNFQLPATTDDPANGLQPSPIDCEVALRQVFEFIDSELSDNDRDAMNAHLKTCQSCFSRVEFEKLIKSKVNALRDDEPAPHLSARIQKLIKDF